MTGVCDAHVTEVKQGGVAPHRPKSIRIRYLQSPNIISAATLRKCFIIYWKLLRFYDGPWTTDSVPPPGCMGMPAGSRFPFRAPCGRGVVRERAGLLHRPPLDHP